MILLKLQIAGKIHWKTSKKRKKQPTENQKNTKTET